ncbi:MAG: Hsp20/alpha crystallin family protein [gamma proteobacterium symbiont of Lucinoma myriamae]|nr:Hsp20/alpha crystallin family protein [gamma proteobacterium symbiont of Lucinoma myriamae]MCU7817744.1 Hsp20/alpha crystallin family protein [gamma proteobacterium symbiont of Lucinoma myriamae]MCU7831736.1 Hsp20/alpha crystallin family protein [gamma proteobacterium symbiont of Lucinoma myriamae]
MKIIAIITFLSVLTISANSHAWWSFPLDDLQWSNHSGSVYGHGDYQPPQYLRIMQHQDFSNYYVYIEIQGIKPQEVDIQRYGPRISIRQVRGRMEESEAANVFRSLRSYSSFTRRLTLPADADPDMSKMIRENNENSISLTIPKRAYHSWGSGN